MKNVRKIVVLLLVLMLVLPVPPEKRASAAAVSDMGISPMALNTAYISLVLDIDSKGIAECYEYVAGEKGTTKITGTLKLKLVTSSGTTTVKSWDLTTYGEVMTFKKSCYVFQKGTYKLVLNVTVTRNGVSETIKKSVTRKYS